MNNLITRDEALAKGFKVFFTGIPCKNNHLSPRSSMDGRCRECRKEQMQRVDKNRNVSRRALQTEYARKWREKNREKLRAYNRSLRRLPLPTRQSPKYCECCGKLPNANRGLNLDHCHETGIFRGWLCSRCNSAIGMLGDSINGISAALKYLKKSVQ